LAAVEPECKEHVDDGSQTGFGDEDQQGDISDDDFRKLQLRAMRLAVLSKVTGCEDIRSRLKDEYHRFQRFADDVMPRSAVRAYFEGRDVEQLKKIREMSSELRSQMRVWCGNCIGNRYDGRFDDIKKELDSIRMEMEGLVGVFDTGLVYTSLRFTLTGTRTKRWMKLNA